MPLSEIDDIFSSKEKSKPVDPVASSSTLPEMKKKKKKKKPKRDSKGPSVLDDAKCEPPADDSDKKANSTEKKRPAPETVLDPSARIPSMKRAKMEKNNGSGNEPAKEKAGKREINQEKEDEDRFKDSRGSGPSACIPAEF